MDNELYHYGVLGMKWGVRRYQNYDGSYTKKGITRYNKAKAAYDQAKTDYKNGKATRSKVKSAKRELNNSYEKLKNDYNADKGKALYAKGKTIEGNNNKRNAVGATVEFGSAVAMSILMNKGKYKMAIISGAAVTAGHLAYSSMVEMQNNKLRAYYAHG